MTHTAEVDKPVVRTVEELTSVVPQSAEEWVALLEMLVTRLAQGRVYRRDPPTPEPAIQRLIDVWIRTVKRWR